MTDLAEFKIETTGYAGAPGMNRIYVSQGTLIGGWDSENVQAAYDDIYAVYSALVQIYLTEVAIEVLPSANIIDDATGNLVGVVAVDEPEIVLSGTTATDNVSRGACALAAFYTDQFVGGKRLRGRSFLGPIAQTCFGDDGRLAGSVLTVISDAYADITDSSGVRLAVYHRPGPVPGGDGYYGDVVSVIPRARPSYLRSRVD